MHNLCVFCTFCTFAQKIFKGWGCNLTWSFGKVLHIKSLKMVLVARITRHKLCMIFAFFLFLCWKIIFDQKLFSYRWDRFDYPGSIVYLSCFCWEHSSYYICKHSVEKSSACKGLTWWMSIIRCWCHQCDINILFLLENRFI